MNTIRELLLFITGVIIGILIMRKPLKKAYEEYKRCCYRGK